MSYYWSIGSQNHHSLPKKSHIFVPQHMFIFMFDLTRSSLSLAADWSQHDATAQIRENGRLRMHKRWRHVKRFRLKIKALPPGRLPTHMNTMQEKIAKIAAPEGRQCARLAETCYFSRFFGKQMRKIHNIKTKIRELSINLLLARQSVHSFL